MDDVLNAPILAPPALDKPSSIYRSGPWKLALAAARVLPLPIALAFGRAASNCYGLFNSQRRQVVFENLLPLFDGDEAQAHAATRRLFTKFGGKLADLLRFEAGLNARARFKELTGWENFEAPARRGGVLIAMAHLGNWEIGATLMIEKKVKFFAVTQGEPGRNFTEERRRARARHGIETIVVGQDAFGFVEIIRRLQDGASVALLIDRPSPQSAASVEFCGRRFLASMAPAELARASGCAVMGGYIVEENGGYAARFFPELPYDRRELGNREGRRQFTQQILSQYEPVIRRYADQWYHFVPIWPK